MAKKAARNINFSVNAVAIEDELTSIEQNLTQETMKVDSFASTGPERLVGNYDFNYSVEGNADFASGQGDATLHGMVGSAGVATAFDPTGAAAAANDPNYDATSVVLASYSIKGAVGAPVTYSAGLEGNSALARNVA